MFPLCSAAGDLECRVASLARSLSLSLSLSHTHTLTHKHTLYLSLSLGSGVEVHAALPPLSCLTQSVFEVVLQKSTPPEIRQLILDYH